MESAQLGYPAVDSSRLVIDTQHTLKSPDSYHPSASKPEIVLKCYFVVPILVAREQIISHRSQVTTVYYIYIHIYVHIRMYVYIYICIYIYIHIRCAIDCNAHMFVCVETKWMVKLD